MTDAQKVELTFQGYAPTVTLSESDRTISGIITVFGVVAESHGLILEDGALEPRMPLSRVKLLRDHDQRDPVGYMTTLSDDRTEASFHVATGENGDRALAEAREKLRDGLSVGFRTTEYTWDDNYVLHVHKAELYEVSLCAIPAFQDAQVIDVAASMAGRKPQPQTLAASTPKENTPMETLTLEQVEAALSEATDGLERTFEARLAAFSAPTTLSAPPFPSMGAFVQELANGNAEAAAFYQSLAVDGTSADDYKRPAWVEDQIRLVEKRRRIINMFTQEPLPDKGMTLEYAKLKSNTTKVEKQEKEGDALKKGKIVLDSDSTPVETYGGASEVSIQTVKRANTAYLTTLFKALGIEYARATEAAARAKLEAAITAQKATAGKLTLPAAATAFDWLDLLIDASEMYDDLGFDLAGTLVSKDVFKKLMRLEDRNGNMLMRVSGEGVNRVGSVDVSGLKGDVASIDFALLPGAADGTASFFDPIAFTTWESAGAPWQLQQENVLNLTEAFSLYGFAAFASQFPTALVPIEFAAAAGA